MTSNNSLYVTIANETVYCVLMCEDGDNLFFTESNPTNFTRVKQNANFENKEKLFDKVSQLTNWDDICGRVAFLTEKEYTEVFG